MSRIFISYRRSDAASEAGRIYDYLESHLGKEALFKDVDAIDAGDDFRKRLNEAVGRCQILLAIIGTNWLQVTDEAGKRRLDNPADWVRLEIETALNRNVRVIPLLLDGVQMPAERDLPKTLQPLAYRNAARVRNDPDFRHDMDRILGVIQRQLDEVSPTVVPSAEALPSESQPSREKLSVAPKVVPLNVRGNLISRRQLIQILGCSAGGLGSVLLVKGLFPGRENWSLPNLKSEKNYGTTVEFNVATVNVPEKSISIARNRAEFVTEDLGGGVTLDLMKIPRGTFTMGSPSDEPHRLESEGPQHQVILPDFLMGKYAITQSQWRAVAALPKIQQDLNPSPSRFSGDNRPVEWVSWWEAVEFCQRLSARLGVGYRLPSEAEWEYACRAGDKTPFHTGETLTARLANYRATEAYSGGPKGNFLEETTVVGSFPANDFGLYDMHGNVWEWCADHSHDGYEGAPSNATAWLTDNPTSLRIIRGGAWSHYPRNCRSAYRDHDSPVNRFSDVGFRVSCSV